jgi:hypothetical protein
VLCSEQEGKGWEFGFFIASFYRIPDRFNKITTLANGKCPVLQEKKTFLGHFPILLKLTTLSFFCRVNDRGPDLASGAAKLDKAAETGSGRTAG